MEYDKNITRMRSAWFQFGDAVRKHDCDWTPQNNDNRRTSLDRLRDKYSGMAIANAVFGMVCFFVIPLLRHLDDGFRWPVIVSGAVLFFAVSLFDFWIWKGLCRIDVQKMPVAEVASLALFYKKWILRGLMAAIPAAIVWMVLFVIATGHDWVGSIVGGGVGLWFSIKSIRRRIGDFRKLSE